MRPSGIKPRRAVITGLSVLLVVIATVAAAPLFAANAPVTTLTIVNNASRDVSHVYLSQTNQNDWGPDLLNDSAISPGATVNLNNVSCPASEARLIVEDSDGCFIYQTVTCGESATVTVTNEAARDCGG